MSEQPAGHGTAAEVQETVARARPNLAKGLLVMALASMPVVVLGLLVRDAFPPIVDLDRTIVRHTTDLTRDHDWLRTLAAVGEYVLHPFAFRGLVVVLSVVLWRRGARYAAVWATSTMLVGTLLGHVLKLVFSRARPEIDDPIAVASGYSYPSGHALNAALGVAIALVLSWRLLGRRDTPSRVGAAALCVLLVLLTDLDRIFRGVHFPSDVVAGNVTGLVIVWASWAAFGPALRARAQRETEEAAYSSGTTPPGAGRSPGRTDGGGPATGTGGRTR